MTSTQTTATLLTHHDLQAIQSLARSQLGAGVWDRVERRRDARFDLVSIHYSGRPGPVVSVGRGRGGRYVLLNHVHGSLRFGRNLAEALGHLPS